MSENRGIRITLLVVQAFVALTALAGGAAVMIGALVPGFSSSWSLPPEYLEGSPFTSYLVPGITLAVVLGGMHIFAFVELARWLPWALFVSAAAGYTTLIWIFVQMVYIPFSFLQLTYFAIGLLEVGLVLLMLGVHRRLGPRWHVPTERVAEDAATHP